MQRKGAQRSWVGGAASSRVSGTLASGGPLRTPADQKGATKRSVGFWMNMQKHHSPQTQQIQIPRSGQELGFSNINVLAKDKLRASQRDIQWPAAHAHILSILLKQQCQSAFPSIWLLNYNLSSFELVLVEVFGYERSMRSFFSFAASSARVIEIRPKR